MQEASGTGADQAGRVPVGMRSVWMSGIMRALVGVCLQTGLVLIPREPTGRWPRVLPRCQQLPGCSRL